MSYEPRGYLRTECRLCGEPLAPSNLVGTCQACRYLIRNHLMDEDEIREAK